MGYKLYSFLRKMFLVLFCSRTAYIVTDNAKKLTSVGLFYKDVGLILFSKIFYVFDVVYVKSMSIT